MGYGERKGKVTFKKKENTGKRNKHNVVKRKGGRKVSEHWNGGKKCK